MSDGYQKDRKKKQQKSFKEDRFGHKQVKEAGEKVMEFFSKAWDGDKKKKKKKRKQPSTVDLERAKKLKKSFMGD